MGETRDYWHLCLNCGGISAFASWELLQWDDEGDYRPSRPGEMDPICVCPHCRWHHTDDDGNPGVEDGTRQQVVARREIYLDGELGLHGEFWADLCEELALDPAPPAEEK